MSCSSDLPNDVDNAPVTFKPHKLWIISTHGLLFLPTSHSCSKWHNELQPGITTLTLWAPRVTQPQTPCLCSSQRSWADRPGRHCKRAQRPGMKVSGSPSHYTWTFCKISELKRTAIQLDWINRSCLHCKKERNLIMALKPVKNPENKDRRLAGRGQWKSTGTEHKLGKARRINDKNNYVFHNKITDTWKFCLYLAGNRTKWLMLPMVNNLNLFTDIFEYFALELIELWSLLCTI